jgi:uncharacterized radical SAM superfamily Fe-S cluster-containing enzyme
MLEPESGCPTACGLCAHHRQTSCCVLFEVTTRCDLGCPVCYASASVDAEADPTIDEIAGWFEYLAGVAPQANIQLSGGEPTLRDDLPDIIELGRGYGFSFFQLNTNGLRLARDADYVQRLARAGLSTVFLQFDGVSEAPYRVLRGASLLTLKLRAVEACAAAGLGVILVPTLVPGVNVHEAGAVVDFAISRLPAVRGVHFQPITRFGRLPGDGPVADAARLTLPDVLRAVVEQSRHGFGLGDFKPAACEHPICSFHGEFITLPEGGIAPLAALREADRARGDGRHVGLGTGLREADRPAGDGCCGGAHGTGERAVMPGEEKARRTAVRWRGASSCGCCGPGAGDDVEPDAWDRALEDVRGRTFSISGMAFQDAWSLDLERLSCCYLHVLSRDLRLVPFCSYNLTDVAGRPLDGAWRSRHGAEAPAR